MRKSFWMIPVVLLFSALGSTAAHADGLVVTNGGGYVTAIDGITLDGTLYNVTFTSNIDNTFAADPYDSPIMNAVQADIDEALGATTLNDEDGAFYGIAAQSDLIAVDALTNPFMADASWESSSTASDENFAGGLAFNSGRIFYANFTPVVVTRATPEPGTVPLTLTGLGVLGLLVVIRKRFALHHSQAT
jgi:hypothetical protein